MRTVDIYGGLLPGGRWREDLAGTWGWRQDLAGTEMAPRGVGEATWASEIGRRSRFAPLRLD